MSLVKNKNAGGEKHVHLDDKKAKNSRAKFDSISSSIRHLGETQVGHNGKDGCDSRRKANQVISWGV